VDKGYMSRAFKQKGDIIWIKKKQYRIKKMS
jgi:hypothetical protein